MEAATTTIPVFDFASCVNDSMQIIDACVAEHNRAAARVAANLVDALDYPSHEKVQVVLAAMLHDIGALARKEGAASLRFDRDPPHDDHAEIGYRLVSKLDCARGVAELVRHHHRPWDRGAGCESSDEAVPRGAHVVHLADRVAALRATMPKSPHWAANLRKSIRRRRGSAFHPDVVDAFVDLSSANDLTATHGREPTGESVPSLPFCRRSGERITALDLARTISQIIDFRSPFTATHSAGVAATSAFLAELAGFSHEACDAMRLAGHLHDIGKLAVPTALLEKPGPLDERETATVHHHIVVTHELLGSIPGLERVAKWASDHHERLDGRGYPRALSATDLPIGSRILAIGDVFTAIAEDRPYRDGCSSNETLRLLRGAAADGGLDRDLVDLVCCCAKDFDDVRRESQTDARREFDGVASAQPN